MCAGFTAGTGTEEFWQALEFGRQRWPVLVFARNANEHALDARMRAQAFNGVQDNRASEEREILLGDRGLHPPALTARGDEGPDSVGGAQARLTGY
jgi:hypothetical protein